MTQLLEEIKMRMFSVVNNSPKKPVVLVKREINEVVDQDIRKLIVQYMSDQDMRSELELEQVN